MNVYIPKPRYVQRCVSTPLVRTSVFVKRVTSWPSTRKIVRVSDIMNRRIVTKKMSSYPLNKLFYVNVLYLKLC